MNNIENKKISVTIILISTIGLIIGYLKKDIYYSGVEFDVSYPLKYYGIYVFGYQLDCINFISVMLLILGLSIYTFLFKTDEEIKTSVKKIKNRFKTIFDDLLWRLLISKK